MPRERSAVERIIDHRREAAVLLSKRQTAGAVCRQIGVSEQSRHRWRQAYGGLKVNQARRLKNLE